MGRREGMSTKMAMRRKELGDGDVRSYWGRELRLFFGRFFMWKVFGNRRIRLTWNWPAVVMDASDWLCAGYVSAGLAVDGRKWDLQ